MKKLFLTACVFEACILPLRASVGTPSAPAMPAHGDGTAMWATPDPHEDSGLTWYQVMGILALCGGTCGGGFLWGKSRNVKIEPQPLTVEMKRDFVTREEFEKHRTSIGDQLVRTHKRIDELARPVAEMSGTLDRVAKTQDTILELLMKGANKA